MVLASAKVFYSGARCIQNETGICIVKQLGFAV